MTSQPVSPREYNLASKNGLPAEKMVRSILRGGYLYKSHFYYIGKISEGYLKLKLKGE